MDFGFLLRVLLVVSVFCLFFLGLFACLSVRPSVSVCLRVASAYSPFFFSAFEKVFSKKQGQIFFGHIAGDWRGHFTEFTLLLFFASKG